MTEWIAGVPPALQAALVAGVVSLITTILTLRAGAAGRRHRELMEPLMAAIQAALTEQGERNRDTRFVHAEQEKRVREHLLRTRSMLGRVSTSFQRLSRLAPSLDDEEILAETTRTLDLYAEYRQHLAGDEVVSYPVPLKAAVASVQKQLAKIFVDLATEQSSRAEPKFAQMMRTNTRVLAGLAQELTEAIERIIRIPILPMAELGSRSNPNAWERLAEAGANGTSRLQDRQAGED